ncbi:DUF3073 domain-containing protein [Nocardia pseudobrasiliensis]|uniref:DUF3073 family protein n=1 Tax=Nocardia pseudobrasiliensis TaxID=45979 RepID=A0A370HSJ3_9NOCA|nr:DUF3073 domain-containing protein [Nocardia pseudobrasiliensis]RDI61499.1 DUF3073 family protein [Nocardia pseudobrasiliensis]
MGRGRAKAKQTKVARDLKYSSPSTDFASLQRELSGHSREPGHSRDSSRSGVLSDEDDTSSRWEDDDKSYDDWRR